MKTYKIIYIDRVKQSHSGEVEAPNKKDAFINAMCKYPAAYDITWIFNKKQTNTP